MQISREEREEAQPIRLPGTCLLTRISMLHGAAVPPEVNIWTVQRDFDEFRKSGGGSIGSETLFTENCGSEEFCFVNFVGVFFDLK